MSKESFGGRRKPALSIRRSLQADESSNMLEVLQADAGTFRRPEVQHKRVRKLGRTNLERSEVCQWITALTTEPSVPNGPPIECPESAKPTARKEMSGHVKDDRPVSVTSMGESMEDCISQEERDFMDQLSSIRLQKQSLAEQERQIQEKLERKQKESRAAVKDSTVSSTLEQQAQEMLAEAIDNNPNNIGSAAEAGAQDPQAGRRDGSRRRRLKGDLANDYAERDEGCLGRLLYGAGSQHEAGGLSASTLASNKAATNSACVGKRRAANLRQEDGMVIRQLMNQEDDTELESVQESVSASSMSKSNSTALPDEQ